MMPTPRLLNIASNIEQTINYTTIVHYTILQLFVLVVVLRQFPCMCEQYGCASSVYLFLLFFFADLRSREDVNCDDFVVEDDTGTFRFGGVETD